MKWLLLVVAFVVSVVLGYLFSLKYKRRADFFKALIVLSQKLDVGINFSRERLHSIISSLDETVKKSLVGLPDNYISYLDGTGELNQEALFKNINILKDNEKEVVFMFFKMLGRSDVDSQSKEIKNFQSRFEEMSAQAGDENKKYGRLSIKMGVIIGLIAVVILW